MSFLCLFCFFFNDTATTEIYTLSLHDALPILRLAVQEKRWNDGFALETLVESLHAAFLQARAQFGEMSMVPRLDRAQNMDRGNIRAGEGAIVDDLLDARAGGSNFRREISKTAGPIADDGSEPGQAAICDEAALDDAAQDIGIDVAAAEKKHDTFASEFRKLAGKTRGQWRRGRAFDHAFLQLDDAKNRDRDLFLGHNADPIDERRCRYECVRADLGDRESVGEGRLHFDAHRFSGLDRRGKTRNVVRFDGDHFRLRPQTFHRERHAGEKPATAHRHDHGVDVRYLLEN